MEGLEALELGVGHTQRQSQSARHPGLAHTRCPDDAHPAWSRLPGPWSEAHLLIIAQAVSRSRRQLRREEAHHPQLDAEAGGLAELDLGIPKGGVWSAVGLAVADQLAVVGARGDAFIVRQLWKH